MFKLANNEEEIFKSMEKQLSANNVEKKFGFNKLAQAIELLDNAAEIFEQHGLHDEAKEIVQIMDNTVKVYNKL